MNEAIGVRPFARKHARHLSHHATIRTSLVNHCTFCLPADRTKPSYIPSPSLLAYIPGPLHPHDSTNISSMERVSMDPPAGRSSGSPAGKSSAAILLGKQYKQMRTDKDIPGISCGLDDDNILEWEIMIMLDEEQDSLYGGE